MSQPTLTGARVHLRPLQRDDRAALLDAAADGALWNLRVTVVPDEDTIDRISTPRSRAVKRAR